MVAQLPEGCELIGASLSPAALEVRLAPWRDAARAVDLLVVLAATATAEVEGISAAGATAASRRYTAIADAELLLNGPSHRPRWALPPLPAGVSPALISWVAVQRLALRPVVSVLGLIQDPPFPHLRLESADQGPAACLSTGRAMPGERVQHLWSRGHRLGAGLRAPLVLAECVPGGTTTAQAVLQGLGLPVADLVSGSALQPPLALKRRLVNQGLTAAALSSPVEPQTLLAAVGDPFQALAAGLLVGSLTSGQPVMLAGGSQMLAVLALALCHCSPADRPALARQVVLGTTAWLADERLSQRQAAFPELVRRVQDHVGLPLLALTSGLRCHDSRHPQLRAYEQGYVKEGVGAGGLTLLAQLRSIPCSSLLQDCECAMDALLHQRQQGRRDGSLGSTA